MKKLAIGAVLCVLSVAVFAQNAADMNLDAANPALIGSDSAIQKLKEVSVEKYESEGAWVAAMSPDEGVIKARLFEGSPAGKKPIPAEEGLNLPDSKVLGVKVDSYNFV